jgi:glycosyltransferase involved in cell wall biosynthesis
MKILFFIESLGSGGKERRLLELVHFLEHHSDHEMLLVLTEENIHYGYVHELQIGIKILKRRGLKKDPRLFVEFYKLCNEFKPDVIHTWGSMLAFYALPALIIKKIPHINSHIADAPPVINKIDFHYFITYLGFRFSTFILSNTYAGLKAYNLSGSTCRVIYNGISLERFSGLPEKKSIRIKYNIRTTFAVIMVASFSLSKNYGKFLDIAEFLLPIRNDITFLSVGGPLGSSTEYDKIKERAGNMNNVMMCGKIDEVESLVNACDIGVLFSFSEGLSNSIIEYMACGKPVIASDTGGTKEIITNNLTGFLITDETTEEIAGLVTDLLDNEEKRKTIGESARLHIEKNFTVDRMGSDFGRIYSEAASRLES